MREIIFIDMTVTHRHIDMIVTHRHIDMIAVALGGMRLSYPPTAGVGGGGVFDKTVRRNWRESPGRPSDPPPL